MVFFKPKISLEEVLTSIPWTYNLADTFISSNGHEEELTNFPCYAVPAKIIKNRFNIGIYRNKRLEYIPVGFSSTIHFQTHHYGINSAALYKDKKRRGLSFLPLRTTDLKIRLQGENRNVFLHDVYTIHGLKHNFPFILLEEAHNGTMNYKFLRRLDLDIIGLQSSFNDSAFWKDYLSDLRNGFYSPPENISESFLDLTKSEYIH